MKGGACTSGEEQEEEEEREEKQQEEEDDEDGSNIYCRARQNKRGRGTATGSCENPAALVLNL